MNRKDWNNRISEKDEDDARKEDYTEEDRKQQYHILIGIRRGEGKYEYINGSPSRPMMLAQMHRMMRTLETCKYYVMQVRHISCKKGAITKAINAANRNR